MQVLRLNIKVGCKFVIIDIYKIMLLKLIIIRLKLIIDKAAELIFQDLTLCEVWEMSHLARCISGGHENGMTRSIEKVDTQDVQAIIK